MPSSSGVMSFWMDIYLEMVNVMLNIVNFQGIGNWNGYLQGLGEFLPYCFSLNTQLRSKFVLLSYANAKHVKFKP